MYIPSKERPSDMLPQAPLPGQCAIIVTNGPKWAGPEGTAWYGFHALATLGWEPAFMSKPETENSYGYMVIRYTGKMEAIG